MAWKKNWKGKRRRRKGSSIGKMKKDLSKIKKQLAVARGVKDSMFDIDCNNGATSILVPFQTQQGTALDERDGDTIIAKSIQIKALYKRHDATQQLRLIVCQFVSASDASFEEVLQEPYGSANDPYQGLYSPYKIGGDCNYRVLADKYYECQSTEGFCRINFTVKIPPVGAVMKYDGVGTSVSAPDTNRVYIFAISDAEGSENLPVLYGWCRQRFDK